MTLSQSAGSHVNWIACEILSAICLTGIEIETNNAGCTQYHDNACMYWNTNLSSCKLNNKQISNANRVSKKIHYAAPTWLVSQRTKPTRNSSYNTPIAMLCYPDGTLVCKGSFIWPWIGWESVEFTALVLWSRAEPGMPSTQLLRGRGSGMESIFKSYRLASDRINLSNQCRGRSCLMQTANTTVYWYWGQQHVVVLIPHNST